MNDHPRLTSPAPADPLAPFRDEWQIERPALDVWSAVRKSPDGRHIRVIIAHAGTELAGKLEIAETAGP